MLKATWLILETAQALRPGDRNETADIYRVDLLAERLSLISRSEDGQAGSGPSRYATADATGELIVFQSEAEDLVAGDSNGVSDLFLHDFGLGQTYRLTNAEQASAHPALDAAGNTLLYDQSLARGPRQILGRGLNGDTDTETLSLGDREDGTILDNHHPAISADGRYIAYLEQATSTGEAGCQVHLYDRATQVYHRQPCPQTLAESSELARPVFTSAGDQIQWFLPGQSQPLTVRNLLDSDGP